MNLKGDYWKYYTQVEYNSPVYCMETDENGNTQRLNKCCFPVRLVDWDEYNEVAYPILSISPTLLTRRLKIEEGKISLFDFVVLALIEEDKIANMEKMFSMAFREPVSAKVYKKGTDHEVRFVFDENPDKFFINKDNYLQVREILMAQSFYFDPIVGENEKSQRVIDKAIQRIIKNNSGTETNLESQISLVRSEFGERDWSNYTYYELRVDYSTIMKKENFRAIHVYRVLGSDAKIPELGAISDAHINPLGEEVLFKKNDRTKDKF